MIMMDLLSLKFILLLLSFTGSCVGLKVLPSGPLEVLLGGNVTIKVQNVNQKPSVIIWNYSDGDQTTNVASIEAGELTVGDPFKGRVSVNATTADLTVSFLKSEDTGDYSLTLLKSGVTTTGEIKIRVLEPVSAVAITSNITEAIEETSTVVLNCSAKGSFLKFFWLNDTKHIHADDIRVFRKDGELSSALTIRGVLRFDLAGPIYCEVKNTLHQGKSAPFNQTVFYGPDPLILKPTKEAQYIKSGSDFNLTCLTSSSPPATFAWFYNGRNIGSTGPVLPLKTIESLGIGMKEGDYQCQANNAKTGRSVNSTAIRFSVLEPIKNPTITGPTTILIANNSTANLSCQAGSSRVTERIWLIDDKPLVASSRVVMSDDKSTVLIKPVQREDNGRVLCRLTNPVDTKEVFFNMTVNYGPEGTKVAGAPEVKVDTRVELNCGFNSVPPPTITWKMNGTVQSVKTATFAIDKATYKDSGTYECEAYNPITGKTDRSSHFLSVKDKITPPGLSDGAIAGIVIACLLAVAVTLGLFFYCRKKVPVGSPY